MVSETVLQMGDCDLCCICVFYTYTVYIKTLEIEMQMLSKISVFRQHHMYETTSARAVFTV